MKQAASYFIWNGAIALTWSPHTAAWIDTSSIFVEAIHHGQSGGTGSLGRGSAACSIRGLP